MGNTAFGVVEGELCLPLAALVWASQRLFNSLHPSRRSLLLGPVLPRAIALLALLFVTCLLATCLFLAAGLSAPDWQTRWSEATLWQALAEGSGLALTLVIVCAHLVRMVPARRTPGTYRDGFSSEQEEG